MGSVQLHTRRLTTEGNIEEWSWDMLVPTNYFIVAYLFPPLGDSGPSVGGGGGCSDGDVDFIKCMHMILHILCMLTGYVLHFITACFL